jgi:hypothetical protein
MIIWIMVVPAMDASPTPHRKPDSFELVLATQSVFWGGHFLGLVRHCVCSFANWVQTADRPRRAETFSGRQLTAKCSVEICAVE